MTSNTFNVISLETVRTVTGRQNAAIDCFGAHLIVNRWPVGGGVVDGEAFVKTFALRAARGAGTGAVAWQRAPLFPPVCVAVLLTVAEAEAVAMAVGFWLLAVDSKCGGWLLAVARCGCVLCGFVGGSFFRTSPIALSLRILSCCKVLALGHPSSCGFRLVAVVREVF